MSQPHLNIPSQLPLLIMICAGVLQCRYNRHLLSRFDVVLRQEYLCSVKNTSVVSNTHLYAHQQAIYRSVKHSRTKHVFVTNTALSS